MHNRAQNVVKLGHNLQAQIQVANHLVSQMCVPDYNGLHVWGAEDLETEPRHEDLSDEELMRDFREQRGVHLWDATEGDSLIGTVVPVRRELDVLEGTLRMPQPVLERWVELGRRRWEDRHREYNSQLFQGCGERTHIRVSTRGIGWVPTVFPGKEDLPRVEDEGGLVIEYRNNVGVQREVRHLEWAFWRGDNSLEVAETKTKACPGTRIGMGQLPGKVQHGGKKREDRRGAHTLTGLYKARSEAQKNLQHTASPEPAFANERS
jgi:hypothetical protein